MADERDRIAEAITCTMTGPVWHGEPLAVHLDGVTAADAAACPLEDAHSIWELVLHLTAWVDIVRERLTLQPMAEATDDEDWPTVPPASARNWTAAVRRLHEAHERLATAVRSLPLETLDAIVPTRRYTVRTMLHGIPEHGAYHGGQIALLRKPFG